MRNAEELRPAYEEFLDTIKNQTKENDSLHHVLKIMKSEIEPQIKQMSKPQLAKALADAIYSIYCSERWLDTQDASIEHFRREYLRWKLTAGHIQEELKVAPKKALSKNAAKGALAKLKEDCKQKAKQEVKQHWLLWQKNPGHYKSKAAFARDMLDKYGIAEDNTPLLTSQKVIEDWCRYWEKE